MTKTLDFAYGTPQEVKVGDDETTFTLVCKNEDRLVDLTTATSITVKIGDRSGYLRGQQISIDSLAKLPTGQFNFSFGKDMLANLPTGNYFLEVWVTDAQGTSIYPSGIPLSFTVTANIENSSGASITTIAFDDFVAAMNKAASTIAKGDPGEGLDIKGQVTSVSALPTTANEGNGYLVNEELYVYTNGVWKDCGPIQGPQGIQGKTGTGISSTTIQYQISNSATTTPTGTWSNSLIATTQDNPFLWTQVTLNYDDGTSKSFYLVSSKGDKGDKGDTGTVDNAGLISAPAFQSLQTQVNNSAVGTNLALGTSSDWQKVSAPSGWGTTYLSNPVYEIKDGETYTLQVEVRNITSPIMLEAFSFTAAGAVIGLLAPKAYASNDTKLIVTFTAKLPEGYGYFMPDLAFSSVLTNAGSYEFRRFKIELGNKATDWCLNPSEILTQSDYAKIKAAIVALGGALS
ncbi:collagen-like protein [Lactiplantibacillus plantarum]|uniref:collagen-like protein n=1 Tax=Lactiplantibacillus plantarum TaxID=1590 RepID=UPI002016D408|nr:collagen-like protein [Lactiplantibacillus plantarum]UQN21485.1 collagen-like protein [Lactiplantibacillus plantarum]